MIKVFLKNLILPISQDEDGVRSEFILNILLIAIICLSFITLIINLFKVIFSLTDKVPETIPFVVLSFIILSFFIFLYFLSRKGLSRFASYILIVSFFLPVTYQVYDYGTDLSSALLSYALIIVMAGVLISTRFAFFATIFISFTIAVIAYLQKAGIIETNRYWVNDVWVTADVIFVSVIFGVIAIVSWLSNREIEKSLARARRSEAELKKERDSLEITVETRTRELKETQAEKMTQLYRFAEFGRLSSGLFHDLINPLTAVSLNIEKVKNAEETRAYANFADLSENIIRDKIAGPRNLGAVPIFELSEYVDKAVVAAKKMEDMVIAVRKQLSRPVFAEATAGKQENKTNFSLKEEIESVIEVLSHKARKANVAMRLFSHEDIKTYGDSVKFNQIALNLVANAIDSYLPASSPASSGTKEGLEKRDDDTRTVSISLSQDGGAIIFEVKDRGIGISEENKPRLFEPFFTTKEEGYGLGIGLSMTKRIIEKDFGGSIEVASEEGEGSVFTVKFPQKQNE